MIFYYIRHGDPTYVPNGLTPLGVRQAEAIGRRIARYPIDEIYSSDSNRAVLTAKPTAELLRMDMTLLPWANEDRAWDQMSFLDPEDGNQKWFFAAKAVQEQFCRPEMLAYGMDWYNHPDYKGTEIANGYLRIQKEARAFMKAQGFEFDEKIGRYKVTKKNDKRIAFFAHHGFGMSFMSVLLNIPYPIITTRLEISHSTLQVIEFSDEEEYCTPKFMTHGNDAHLYADNIPTKFENRIYY